MAQNIRTHISSVLFFFALITAFGQSEIGLNVGYIRPFLMPNSSTSHYSGNAEYSGSAFITLKYKEKATNTMFLGVDLSFDNYKLHFKESLGSHFGAVYKKDIKYKFNYLYLDFYPEWVFGKKVKFYFNTGITFGILLNSNMSGTIGSSKRIDLPDGHWYYEYSEKFIEGNAKDDLRDFNVGVGMGAGIQYSISDNWRIQIDISNRFLTFPVDSGFAKSQMDLLISAGATYTINRNKKPLLFRSGSQE